MSQNNKGGLIEGGICQFADHGGPNGKAATVRTGWIIKSGSNISEMTTLFVSR